MFGRPRLLSIFLAALHVYTVSLVAVSPAALAQSLDNSPPVIEFERIERGILGDTQVFSGTVTDDRAVADVVLHYRLGDQGPYESTPMESFAGTTIYSTSVSTANTSETVLPVSYTHLTLPTTPYV